MFHSALLNPQKALGSGLYIQFSGAAVRIQRWNLGREKEDRDRQVDRSKSSMTKRGNIRDFRDRDPRPVIGFNKAHETNRRSKNTFVCQKCEY